MPAGSRRSRRDARHAGAWRWLPLASVVLAIVPLPGWSLSHARPASSKVRSSAAATAVHDALDQLGKRHQWGGQGPEAFECSGLTMMAYRTGGVTIPRVARWQYEVGRHVPLRQLAAGDLVFYARDPSRADTIDHVGMYLGAGRMVEAPNHTQPVSLAAVQRFQRAHRLPADGVVGRTTWSALISNGRQRSRSPAC
jgi:cell wall-associated NlpC family hydrolase